MVKEVKKWINSYSNMPIGNIAVDFCLDNSGYSNLNELVFNITNSLDISFLTIRPKDVQVEENLELPEHFLCYNANSHEITISSIKYERYFQDAKKYDYCFLLDNSFRVSLKAEHFVFFLVNIFILYFVYFGS